MEGMCASIDKSFSLSLTHTRAATCTQQRERDDGGSSSNKKRKKEKKRKKVGVLCWGWVGVDQLMNRWIERASEWSTRA